MRIGIDGTHWNNQRGYGRYARGLITALCADPHDDVYTLFVDGATREAGGLPAHAELVVVDVRRPQASAQNSRSVRDVLALTARAARVDLDVMFYPSVYTYFPMLSGARKLVGIHDVIAEKYPALIFPRGKGQLAWAIKSLMARIQADALVTVSEYARREIARRFGYALEKIAVVGEAPDSVFRRVDDDAAVRAAVERVGVPRAARYFMYLGGVNPHKNVIALLRAFVQVSAHDAMRDVHLVLVGPHAGDLFTPGIQAAQRESERLGAVDRVHFTDYLPDDDVVLLLNGAIALILPSLEEGYGLPGVEAAACGIPVIATRNSALPDVLAGGGIFFDPRQPDALRSAMMTLANDPAQRAAYAAAAYERSLALTWAHAAEQFRAAANAVMRAALKERSRA